MVFKTTGFIQRREIKSRRDGILLTVDFNLRTGNVAHTSQSPAGTILLPPQWGSWGGACIVPAGLFGGRVMLASP